MNMEKFSNYLTQYISNLRNEKSFRKQFHMFHVMHFLSTGVKILRENGIFF